MAKRRTNSRNSGKYNREPKETKKPIGLVFWAAFFVLIFCLFVANRDHILENLENSGIPENYRIWKQGATLSSPGTPAAGTPAAGTPADAPAGTTQSAPRPIEQQTGSQSPVALPPPPAQAPATPAPVRQTPVEQSSPGRSPAESTLEQTLYFIQVDDDGEILRNKVTRRIPISGTPLLDTLNALIDGPSPAEERRKLRSFIRPGTKVLGAAIEGTTARINFSDDFQINESGMDGFIAQLVQVIWTATEFPNVRNVQILIEGNRIDHLGEGVPIWSPLNRQSF